MVKKHKDQLSLFATVIKSASLIADSPKKAFYRIRIEEEQGKYEIVKESGAADKILDCRRWTAPTLEKAEQFFDKKIEQKQRPGRRRRYKLERKRGNK